MVFDFGGGTCDIALFRVAVPRPGEQLKAATLSVSRYHRLGGGDIDAAIVHEVLIPQLQEQNRLKRFDLSFEDKARGAAPALLALAEGLKVGLCSEIWRLKSLGRYEGMKGADIRKTRPGSTTCRLPSGPELVLSSPSLDVTRFDRVLAPFLDLDLRPIPASSSAAAASSRRWSRRSRDTSGTRRSSTSATRRSSRGRSPAGRPSTPCPWP